MLAFDHSFFRALSDNSTDLVLCLGDDLSLRYASSSCIRALGWSGPALLALHLPLRQLEVGGQQLQQAAKDALAGLGTHHRLITRLRHKNGAAVPVEVDIHAERVQPGMDPARLLVVVRLSSEGEVLRHNLAVRAAERYRFGGPTPLISSSCEDTRAPGVMPAPDDAPDATPGLVDSFLTQAAVLCRSGRSI